MSLVDGVLEHPPLQLIDNGEAIVLRGDGHVLDVELYGDDFNHQSNVQQSQAATNQTTIAGTLLSIGARIQVNTKVSILKIKLMLRFFIRIGRSSTCTTYVRESE
jgi:hypothetical protein